ncbi:MAG: polyphosphate kinase 1 [Nitrospirota bacterium]|nr:polyphosphate kinase 1 [Nitrospirota bacterium]
MSTQPTQPQVTTHSPVDDLDDPKLYLNRELSWLQFNARVLEEAEDAQNPLLERVKFLSIFSSNLDEFFMIRISGLREQLSAGVLEAPPDGMSTSDQLAAIRQELLVQLSRFSTCWEQDVLPKLRNSDIHVLRYPELQPKQRQVLRRYFSREIFPALTPLAFDPAHPFPHISNLSLNLAVLAKDPDRGECFARVKIPDIFPRLVCIPNEDMANESVQLGLTDMSSNNFVWIEEVVAANLNLLFPGLKIVAAYLFRVTRDADFEIEEDEAADLLASIEEQVDMRHFGSVVRLEIDQSTPEHIRDILIRNLSLAPYQVYTLNPPLGFSSLMELTRIERPDLKFPSFVPSIPEAFSKKESIFSVIRREDVVLCHPYDSFTPVVEFIREASRDPQVLAIKQTLYRVGANSPIVEALMEARENGKQVAVLFELKARFDEDTNIEWARKLDDEGVHIVYGVLGLKTHAKMCLVVRRDEDGIRRYVHLGTGNYNPVTSRFYTDLSYFTCNPAMGSDISDLFNSLTGYSRKDSYSKLLVAPKLMRPQIIERIHRETQRQKDKGDGYIALKMNALVDKACIQALYRASQAGVKIDLQIRGVCGLRPGVPGVSETITVTSVVGRFLEHARMYYFRNGGQEELFLGSADLMPRNLDRRVEVLFPIESAQLRKVIYQDLLHVNLHDNVKCRQLLEDGQYMRLKPMPEEKPLNSQEWLLNRWRGRNSLQKP